jgi:hypothetical protein
MKGAILQMRSWIPNFQFFEFPLNIRELCLSSQESNAGSGHCLLTEMRAIGDTIFGCHAPLTQSNDRGINLKMSSSGDPHTEDGSSEIINRRIELRAFLVLITSILIGTSYLPYTEFAGTSAFCEELEMSLLEID